mmetsp:Transcript_147799/g.474441  ORF Transcript_147799/g.474441 Transcript_147799/m.474441 type:complete len:209 (+) Transcript_147799:740-1366(+)
MRSPIRPEKLETGHPEVTEVAAGVGGSSPTAAATTTPPPLALAMPLQAMRLSKQRNVPGRRKAPEPVPESARKPMAKEPSTTRTARPEAARQASSRGRSPVPERLPESTRKALAQAPSTTKTARPEATRRASSRERRAPAPGGVGGGGAGGARRQSARASARRRAAARHRAAKGWSGRRPARGPCSHRRICFGWFAKRRHHHAHLSLP